MANQSVEQLLEPSNSIFRTAECLVQLCARRLLTSNQTVQTSVPESE